MDIKLKWQLWKNSGLFWVMLMTLLGLFGTVGLTGCHYTPEQKADWITSKISSKLDLTKDQRAKLEAVKQTFLDIRKAHMADRIQHINDVKQLILSDQLDSVKVKSLISQRQKIVDQNFDVVFAKVSDFHKSLTPEQKKKAIDLIDKFESHMDD